MQWKRERALARVWEERVEEKWRWVDGEYGGDQAMTRVTQHCHILKKEKQNKVGWEWW
jgi:hypothetical protein